MLPGNPLLAAYDIDGTIRTYELVNGVFVQLAAAGGFTHGPNPPGGAVPLVEWADQSVIISRNSGLAADSLSRYVQLRSGITLAEQDTDSIPADTPERAWRGGFARGAKLFVGLSTAATGHIGKRFVDNGALVPDAGGMAFGATGLVSVKPTRDGAIWAAGQAAGETVAFYYNGGPGSAMSAALDATRTVPTGVMAWDASGTFLLTGAPGGDKVSIIQYERSDHTAQVTFEQLGNGASLIAIETAPVGRNVAISWLVDGAPVTRLYRRLGGFLQFLEEFPGIGQSLAFTADGTMIVDAATRKALKYDLDLAAWTSADSAMTNVAFGNLFGVVSDHAPEIVADYDIYQNLPNLVAEQALGDYSGLRLALATNAAPAYNINHASITDAIGAAAVTTGEWPPEGVPLSNVAIVSSGGGMTRVTVDDPQHLVLSSDLVFRHAFIFNDDLPGKPVLLRYDFKENVVAVQNTRIVFDLPDLGLLVYAG